MSTQIPSPCKWAVRPLEWTGSGDGPKLQAVEGLWKTWEGGYPHKVSTSWYLRQVEFDTNVDSQSHSHVLSSTMSTKRTTMNSHCIPQFTMTMATTAQHAHTNMPSNDQVSDWKSHATVSMIFSFTLVFTDKKVFNFILLLITTNRNNMREDKQGDNNTNEYPTNLMRECQWKSAAVREWMDMLQSMFKLG